MILLGIDEAGRGPVIGPLVMAGVVIDGKDEKKLKALGVRDSKELTRDQREYLEKEIIAIAKDYIILKLTAAQIDKERERVNLNVLEAEKMAKIIQMAKADKAIIDAPQVSTEKFGAMVKAMAKTKTKIISENKADVNYPVCAAASILAKVERDREIKRIEKENDIVINSGYPHDPVTIAFLKSCNGKYPDFVRKSWITAIQLAEESKQRKLGDY